MGLIPTSLSKARAARLRIPGPSPARRTRRLAQGTDARSAFPSAQARRSRMAATCFPYGFPTGYSRPVAALGGLWPRCVNAEPGTFGHECGRPAVFVGTNRRRVSRPASVPNAKHTDMTPGPTVIGGASIRQGRGLHDPRQGGSASPRLSQPSSSSGSLPASTWAANQPGLRPRPDQVRVGFSGCR